MNHFLNWVKLLNFWPTDCTSVSTFTYHRGEWQWTWAELHSSLYLLCKVTWHELATMEGQQEQCPDKVRATIIKTDVTHQLPADTALKGQWNLNIGRKARLLHVNFVVHGCSLHQSGLWLQLSNSTIKQFAAYLIIWCVIILLSTMYSGTVCCHSDSVYVSSDNNS